MPAIKGSKVLLSVIVVTCFVNVLDCYESAGNILDVSWRLPELEGVPNSPCEKDLQDMYTNLRNMTLWAIETPREVHQDCSRAPYINWATGECLKEDETATVPGPPRQYCLVRVTLHSLEQEKRHSVFVENFDPLGSAHEKLFYSGDRVGLKRNVIHWGVCAPASCPPDELESLLQLHFSKQTLAWNQTDLEYQVSVSNSTSCQKPGGSKPFTTGALLFFWIMGISIGLGLLVSSYHWYHIRHLRDKEVEYPSIVKAFSVIYHLTQLGKKDKSDELGVLWGLRVLSICFIILDHRFVMTIAGPVSNRQYLEETYHTFSSIFISHGDLLVDSFFVLSGLLSSYSLLKMSQKSSLNVPLLIIYRYIRLAPALAVTVLFMAQILPLTGSGPLWPIIMEPEAENCKQNWWINLVMLNNYINTNKMCLVHAWYIPCDFHYFLVSLAICALFRIQFRVLPALVVLATLLVASVLVPAFITYALKLPGTLLFLNDFMTNPRDHIVFQNTYIGSHVRAGPYFLGMLTGYLIFKYHKPDKKVSTPLSLAGTVVSLGILLGAMASGTVFYDSSRPYSVIEATIFAGLQRPVWAAGLCLLIVCCVFGHVPVISVLLTWSPWTPLGKLVYGAYLVHMIFQIRDASLSRQPFHMDPLMILGRALGDMVLAFAVSLLLYISVEMPIREIVKTVIDALTGNKKSKDALMTEGIHWQSEYNNKAVDVELDTQPELTPNNAMRQKEDDKVEKNLNSNAIEMNS